MDRNIKPLMLRFCPPYTKPICFLIHICGLHVTPGLLIQLNSQGKKTVKLKPKILGFFYPCKWEDNQLR